MTQSRNKNRFQFAYRKVLYLCMSGVMECKQYMMLL